MNAYDAPRRARYPSLARNSDGQFVLLFTSVTKEQEDNGVGDVMIIRSTDEGESWSSPEIVYSARDGIPTTAGSLTMLGSNKLVASLAELDEDSKAKSFRMLTSADGGIAWDVGAPLNLPDVVKWACPYGRLIEGSVPDASVLLMPVYGTLSVDDVQQDKTSAGLMRSTDGGLTWGDFSIIAADPKTSVTYPAVLSTGAQSLVALVDGTDGQLYRCTSDDGGRNWTDRDQVLLGRQPQLVRISNQAVACVASLGEQKYGSVWIGLSYDDARSWRCDRNVMGYRGIYARRPRADEAHWGWPVAVALDDHHMLVALGRTQLHGGLGDGPQGPEPIDAEQERIEVVFFKRDDPIPAGPSASRTVPEAARDRWERVGQQQSEIAPGISRTKSGELIAMKGGQELIWLRNNSPDCLVVSGPGSAESFMRSTDAGQTWHQQPVQLPPGFRGNPGVGTRLSSGRLVFVISEWLLSQWDDSSHKVAGRHGGYTDWDPDTKADDYTRMCVIRSDDNGKTWHGTETGIDISPFQWAVAGGRIFELSDGTVILPIWGCRTRFEVSRRIDSGGLLRSTDGGETWGDFSTIVYDEANQKTAYNEIDVAPVDDDLWVAFVRTEPRGWKLASWMSRSVSTDRGYTWTKPELCFIASVPQVVILPDGGIAVGASWGGVHLTYDLGRTWSRVLPGGNYAKPILVNNDTLLVGNGQNWGTFDVWRRIPSQAAR